MSYTNDDQLEFSCEFFPPRTEKGMDKLIATRNTLDEAMSPAFYSVTFGAGGTTRDRTMSTVDTLRRNGNSTVTPHISCIGSTRAQLRELLDTYVELDIRHLVALRGDLPESGEDNGDFKHANELVAFIREQTGDHFHIDVAAYPEYHPEAPSPEADFDNFVRKVRAGADSAMTQYFYNVDAYLKFMERCEAADIGIPVVPGIMPITNYASLARFSDNCGAEIPRWIRKQLEAYGDDTDSLKAFGLDVVTRLCMNLLDQGAPGLHFYTLNQSEATRAIWERLSG